LRKAFEEAKKNSPGPAIIFINKMDLMLQSVRRYVLMNALPNSDAEYVGDRQMEKSNVVLSPSHGQA
jgi:hypothetical protein